MAQSYLIFDFGANEEAAQQARHRLEGWKQAFRLDKKLQLKFERSEPEKPATEAAADKPKADKPKADKGKGGKGKGTAGKPTTTEIEKAGDNQHIRLIVRLDFSDHEKLSHHRWLERIPTEAPFKDAAPRIIRHGEADFEPTAELFDSLT